MTYFVKCNLLLFSFGIAAMIFMKERKLRILFILWTLPLTLFFSGYVCFAASPIRFILPALFGLAAAIGCGEFWNVTWNRRTLSGAAGLLLLMILAYNPYFHVFISTRLYHSMSNAAHMDAWFLIRMAALGICLAATLLAIRRKISVPVCCWIAAFSLFFIGSGELLWGFPCFCWSTVSGCFPKMSAMLFFSVLQNIEPAGRVRKPRKWTRTERRTGNGNAGSSEKELQEPRHLQETATGAWHICFFLQTIFRRGKVQESRRSIF